MRHANQAEAMPKETLARRSCKYQPEAGADGLRAAGLLRAEQTPTLPIILCSNPPFFFYFSIKLFLFSFYSIFEKKWERKKIYS